MIQVTAETHTVATPEGTPVIILKLDVYRRTTPAPVYLLVRMSVDEARSLSEQLLSAAMTPPAPPPIDLSEQLHSETPPALDSFKGAVT
jgi:hypothetical protein